MSLAHNTATADRRAIGAPNPIDQHVGARVRMRRKFLGISQERLAEALGLTFQQVQKYERGSNRISASKLYEIGRFLKAPVEYFFEGIAAAQGREAHAFAETAPDQYVHSFLMSPEGIELATLFPNVKGKFRRRVLELVRSLAEDGPEVPAGHA